MNINYKNQDNNAFTAACSSAAVATCATVTTKAESITEQLDVAPTVIPAGNIVVKIPVVLAETNITIPVEATYYIRPSSYGN